MRVHMITACLTAACSFAFPALAQDTVNLVGTWKGPRERVHVTQPTYSDTATIVITEQKGMTFRGEAKWTSPTGEHSEPFVGAFPISGKIGAGSSKDGQIVYELINPTTLNSCYTETGSEFLTSCSHLTKQP